jgi:hypothetical protein
MGRKPVNHPWVILTKRHDGDVRSPTDKQLADALLEIYTDNGHGHRDADHEEHGSAMLSVGSDDGPMYILEILCGGTVNFEEWADQDCEMELAPPKQMTSVPKELALELWVNLAHGKVARVRNQSWAVSE